MRKTLKKLEKKICGATGIYVIKKNKEKKSPPPPVFPPSSSPHDVALDF